MPRSIDSIFHEGERVALFIDGANLYGAARNLSFEIDYRRLLDYFRSRAYVVRAFYYTALLDEQDYSPIRPLVDWLDYNGYTMVTKPAKEFTDATGRRRVNDDMDVELTVDVMEMADHVDHIVIFSGDGDFRRLVEAIQRRGVRVTVVSTIRTHPPMVTSELRRQVDVFLDLKDLEPVIARSRAEAEAGRQRGERRRKLMEDTPLPASELEPEDDDLEDDGGYDDEDEDEDEPASALAKPAPAPVKPRTPPHRKS